ncbi:hypothetical protein N657DRAFT_649687 [Parathielavia appendiculata]|uniref:Uncharacterized protein n=1 Tax=Parathielavia appendiculata TaxID=2587402 RepID=A0AAN6TTB3_9PEZI|nr:hypothetical protein N657DRAFT_649672 [Parathielavia appendiculata]KAK4119905.1 hypothetical protein N657DRAFT_649687 [Parathielavia appendiculata]
MSSGELYARSRADNRASITGSASLGGNREDEHEQNCPSNLPTNYCTPRYCWTARPRSINWNIYISMLGIEYW